MVERNTTIPPFTLEGFATAEKRIIGHGQSRRILLSEGRIGCLLDVFAVFKVLMKQLEEYFGGEMSTMYSWASLNMDPDALQ